VVNFRSIVNSKGKPMAQALTAIELEQVNNLVKEAMGFSAERGDSLNVVNSAFASDTIEVIELPLWKQPDNIELAKTGGNYLMLALLALFVWFSVLRPLLRKFLEPAQVSLPAPGQEAPVTQADQEQTLLRAQAQAQGQERQDQRHLENIKYAHEMADKDPQIVAALMKHWLENDDE
jgi:flagellar M-ring protein FliF